MVTLSLELISPSFSVLLDLILSIVLHFLVIVLSWLIHFIHHRLLDGTIALPLLLLLPMN